MENSADVGEVIKMAQAYPYQYKGETRMKQDLCKASMPLDKVRIWLDFNELCAEDRDGAPIYLFSRADIVNDSEGNYVELYDGMKAYVFDGDLDEAGRWDALLAEGIVIGNFLGRYPDVKWLIKLKKKGDGYAYHMSDL